MESWRGAYDLPGRGDVCRSLEPGKTCPHNYRWHSWKNATQMPAIIVRVTVSLHRDAAESAGTRAEEGAVAAPGSSAMVCRVSHKTAHGIICASVDRCTDSRELELRRRAHV